MKTFVYTELQMTLPFTQVPWADINQVLLQQPGIVNKTWLAGCDSHSVGGFYEFDSAENAQKFVTVYFPTLAKELGVAQRTLIFDAPPAEEASVALKSPYFGALPTPLPAAYVYTEIQISVPTFDSAPWAKLNPELKEQPGILTKTWLYGAQTKSIGGFYSFDSIDNAKRFALDYFPTINVPLKSAFTVRVFDADVVTAASQEMSSPFYGKV